MTLARTNKHSHKWHSDGKWVMVFFVLSSSTNDNFIFPVIIHAQWDCEWVCVCVIWKTFNHALAHTNAMNFGIHGQTRTIYNFLFSELSIGTDSALSHTYWETEWEKEKVEDTHTKWKIVWQIFVSEVGSLCGDFGSKLVVFDGVTVCVCVCIFRLPLIFRRGRKDFYPVLWKLKDLFGSIQFGILLSNISTCTKHSLEVRDFYRFT